MKKTTLQMSNELAQQIDDAVQRWGFAHRAEFIRLACIDFLRNDHLALPAGEKLDEYRRVILSLRNRRRTLRDKSIPQDHPAAPWYNPPQKSPQSPVPTALRPLP